ncbi:MAG: arabinan endo-1,5-alpha-L-arabinosidase, partial [Anaerolineaceae bacterium]
MSYTRVSVHDPSIIKANGSYYIIGSHMAYAKSDDLMNWKTFRLNINNEYSKLMGEIWEDYMKTPSNQNLSGNLWAPDIIYNDVMGKYCMYLSINGNDFNSAIVLLTADEMEGTYEYIGPVVYSGFNTDTHPVEKTDVYKVLGEKADLRRYQSTKNTKLNAIDPVVLYDEEGNMWMSFGSWFGGIYILRLDPNTGLRDYSYTYITEPNVSDQYYGYKIGGGNGVSGEGPYIHKFGDYYYLFLSYGGLAQEGGYQMRVFRSEDITGPYVDELGQSAIYTRHENNLFNNIGIRLIGSYKFSGSANTTAAQAHNSVFLDDDGKMYNVFHTRFAGGMRGNPEYHEVHVHQLFLNANDWLVMAPYEYSGETISEIGYNKKELVGNYEFVVHNPTSYYQTVFDKPLGIAKTLKITLKSNGNVIGDATGTWSYKEGTPYMSITIDEVQYDGVFIKQANETEHKLVMTFTALGNNVT